MIEKELLLNTIPFIRSSALHHLSTSQKTTERALMWIIRAMLHLWHISQI